MTMTQQKLLALTSSRTSSIDTSSWEVYWLDQLRILGSQLLSWSLTHIINWALLPILVHFLRSLFQTRAQTPVQPQGQIETYKSLVNNLKEGTNILRTKNTLQERPYRQNLFVLSKKKGSPTNFIRIQRYFFLYVRGKNGRKV